MNEQQMSQFGAQLRVQAQGLDYPPTPDLASAFLRKVAQQRPARRFAWALVATLVVLASLLAVPDVRARILEFLQIGAVRIFLPQETDQLAPSAAATQTMTPTRLPEGLIDSELDLDGETSLEAARAAVDFPINLPQYPEGIENPDRVFLQGAQGGQFVVLVWLDDEQQIEIVLYVIGEGIELSKGPPEVIEVVEVDGALAIWTTGEYILTIEGYQQPMKFVRGPVLIWAKDGITYRLEIDLPLEQMVLIAESIN